MSKDQAIGGAILVVCLLVAIGYALIVIFPAEIYGLLGQAVEANTGNTIRLYAVLIPMVVALFAILFIGAWIGWTMATTPPPKPIQPTDIKEEENKDKDL